MNIWVDITGLTEAADGGVPRTVASLVREWLACEGGLRLCTYQPKIHSFVECPRESIREWLACRDHNSHDSPPTPEMSRARTAFKRFGRLLPSSVRKFSRAGIKHVIELTSAITQWSRARRIRDHDGPIAAFRDTDILLSPGWSWEFRGYAETVNRARQTVGLRYVPLIHDVIPLLMPQLFESWLPACFEPWFVEALNIADAVITNSENSRRDILRIANDRSIPVPRIAVIQLGADLPTRDVIRPAALGASEAPFVLMVGTIEARKNHGLAYQVWRRLIDRHGNAPRLVIAGSAGWLTGDLLYQITHDPITRDRVVWLNRVSNQELGWLYQHCLFTIYPSLYEGWGLPVAESLLHGKYCITSNVSSLPEVGGELVDYHDPIDAMHMLRLVEKAAFDDSFRTRREQIIRARYTATSWADTASRLLEILRQWHGEGQAVQNKAA